MPLIVFINFISVAYVSFNVRLIHVIVRKPK